MRGTGGTISNLQIFETNFPTAPVTLGAGQSRQLHFTGIAPAPVGPEAGDSTAQGWGVYAQLQEQPPGLSSWFTIDEVLVLFGNWPNFNGVAGPGGGVIRLDPYYTGTTQFVPFPAVAILGTSTLDVTQIDPASVRLQGVAPISFAYQDVATPFSPFIGKTGANACTTAGPDGFTDLSLFFDATKIASALGAVTNGQVVTLQLTGNFLPQFGGGPIVGEDVVVIKTK